VLTDPKSIALITGEFNFDWLPTVQPTEGVAMLFVTPVERSHEKHVLAKVLNKVFDSNLKWDRQAFASRKAKVAEKMRKSTIPHCLVEDAFPVTCWSASKGQGQTARLIKGQQTVCPLRSLSRVYEVVPL
jgi:hypothetical protein